MVAAAPAPGELHAALYGVEGVLLRDPRSPAAAAGFQSVCGALLGPDAPEDSRRADVLAQALRAGTVLCFEPGLGGGGTHAVLATLASGLLERVGDDGAVRFSRSQPVANAWCAMFALQALAWWSRSSAGAGPPPEVGLLV
jgi:hypothetical protein